MANNFNRDLYKILNVTPHASAAEIKAAYRRLVHLYHPDAAGSDADVSKFKEVQEAYEILSKPSERQKYDIIYGYYTEKFNKDFDSRYEAAKKRFGEQIKKEQEQVKQKQKNKTKRESFSKSINDVLDNLFHTSKRKTSQNEEENFETEETEQSETNKDSDGSKANEAKEENTSAIDGADIHTAVSISLLEAFKGTERKVNILHTEPCPSCSGRKFINGSNCSVCKGSGQLQNYKKLNVKIPKGVKQGTKVKVKNEGSQGLNGGKNGDLYIVINIEKDKYFNIDGLNILINLPVSAYEAALGADIKLDLLKEKVIVKIPPLISSGQKLRLTGLGLENKSKTERGACIITVIIKMPESLTEEEKALYEKLKQNAGENVRKDFKYAK